MGLWNSLSSCFGIKSRTPPNNPIQTDKEYPANSITTFDYYTPSTSTPNITEKSPAPPFRLSKPLEPTTPTGKSSHAKLPSHARTSQSFKEAAKKPRGVHMPSGIDEETGFGGFDDPCKKWFREENCRDGRVWDARMEASYESWMRAVTRGRGCT